MSNAQALVPFGFTALESEIYVFLLDHSPATGYRIAQGINKPAANTYKALQSLQVKGAILVEEGSNRMCRAVALDELSSRLSKDFERRQKAMVQGLKSAGKRTTEDERLYILRSPELVLSKFRELASRALSTLLVKVRSDGLPDIQSELVEAKGRGVHVAVLSDDGPQIDELDIVRSTTPLASFGCVRDGEEAVVGSETAPGETEAVYTRSVAFARTQLVSMSAEIALAHVADLLAADEKKSRIQRVVEGRQALLQNLQE